MSENSENTSTDSTNRFARDISGTGGDGPDTFTAATVDSAEATDRQERVEGFVQSQIESTSVLLIGAGGVGSEVADGAVPKGYGKLTLCDEDIVDDSNLNRQKFVADDVGTNKTVALAQNLAPFGTTGTDLRTVPHHFEDALALGVEFSPDIVVCAVDSDDSRREISDHFYDDTPVVMTGMDRKALGGYVFVQEPGGPCFNCFKPDASGGEPCAAVPAVIDPAKVVGGYTLYAIDSMCTERSRDWNLFEFFLSGGIPPRMTTVDRDPECDLCGGE